MGTYIVRHIFKSGYYRKCFEEVAKINKFMRIINKEVNLPGENAGKC